MKVRVHKLFHLSLPVNAITTLGLYCDMDKKRNEGNPDDPTKKRPQLPLGFKK